MAAITKFSFNEIHKSVQQDYEFAQENLKLAKDVPAFSDQLDYWEGKTEALVHVLHALETTQQFVKKVEDKKETLLARFLFLMNTKII
jgi:chemotaxis regulatin CheY-phosphate phosphatase CheZ